jgi:hypothetical protein
MTIPPDRAAGGARRSAGLVFQEGPACDSVTRRAGIAFSG